MFSGRSRVLAQPRAGHDRPTALLVSSHPEPCLTIGRRQCGLTRADAQIIDGGGEAIEVWASFRVL